jgi:hypothetical protein
VGSPLSPFFYPEHLGSPPPAHMGGIPYSLDPHKGPVSEYCFLLFDGKSQMIKTKREGENSYNCSKISGDINDAGGKRWQPMSLTIGGKFTAGVNDTGGHIFFYTDRGDTGGKFSTGVKPPVSTDLIVHFI